MGIGLVDPIGAVVLALLILVAGRRYLSDDHAKVTQLRLARDLTLADAA
jgi:hypothetical protein